MVDTEVVRTGMETFLTSLTTGLAATEIWGAIAPISGLIIIVTLVAIGRRVLNKNLNSAKSGRAGRA